MRNILFSLKILFLSSKKYFILKISFLSLKIIFSMFILLFYRRVLNILTSYNEDLLVQLLSITILYLGVYILEIIVDSLNSLISYKYNDEINYYLDNLMIEKTSTSDLSFYDSSDLANMIQNSWDMIYSTKNLMEMLFNFIRIIAQIIISIILLLELEWFLIFTIMIFCVPYFIFDNLMKKVNYFNELETAINYRKTNYYKLIYFSENLQEIKLYNLNDFFKNKYKNEVKKMEKIKFSSQKKSLFYNIISSISLFINDLIIYYFLIVKFVKKLIGVADLTYFVSIVLQFRNNINNFTSTINSFSYTLKAIGNVQNFFEINPVAEQSGVEPLDYIYKIEFKNVSFSYPNSNNKVLNNCSFVINENTVVGLVGLNGAGKSTIIKLLLKLYIPQEGEILINNKNINSYKLFDLRKQFNVLFQDYMRYSLTLRENIGISNLNELHNDEQLLKACSESDLDTILSNYENGLDANMTKRFYNDGKELSGGQWQKVALARAFFRNGSVTLLDEPSSSLDPLAEEEIFSKYKKIYKNKITFLISHRLSSIKISDIILLLDDGKILESGSHDNLIKKKGRYFELFKLQSEKYKQDE